MLMGKLLVRHPRVAGHTQVYLHMRDLYLLLVCVD
jgi:hypothetical protein